MKLTVCDRTYIYGVACATNGDSFGLILPNVSTQSMQIFLDDFSNLNIAR